MNGNERSLEADGPVCSDGAALDNPSFTAAQSPVTRADWFTGERRRLSLAGIHFQRSSVKVE